MKNYTPNVLPVLLLLLAFQGSAQEQIDFDALSQSNIVNSISASAVQSISPAGALIPDSVKSRSWEVQFLHRGIRHGNKMPFELEDSTKLAKTLPKMLSGVAPSAPNSNSSALLPPPVVDAGAQGNAYNGYVPPDNHIAVADNGYLVSVTNSSVIFADGDGDQIYSESFSAYYDFLGLSGIYYDPRVIYDPVEEKFIMVVLNGTTVDNTHVVISFSSSDDPMGQWWTYVLDGNPINNLAWFDFPSIGVSDNDLYISGNLFDADDNYVQSLVYQVEKINGFTGGSIDLVYYNGLESPTGNSLFTMVPISHGLDESVGPGLFFVSSHFDGGEEVFLSWTTGNINQNPFLETISVPVPSYSISGNGLQLGSPDFMSTNDCRVNSGFFADETIHFVFNSESQSGYTGLYYGKIDVPSMTGTGDIFEIPGFDCAFPSIAPFTRPPAERTALIGFLRTGASIYPEFQVVSCDENYQWSAPVLVKEGEVHVDALLDEVERWGDYSGIARRHHPEEVEIWVSGCYGSDEIGSVGVLGTWLGKIVPGGPVNPPVADFSADVTTIAVGESVEFTSLSTNFPESLYWSFSGGEPLQSSEPSPSVTYNSVGTFDVTLSAINQLGSDIETKTGYIQVTATGPEPVAHFAASQTVITAGEDISFTDLSSNGPESWAWEFPGGTPSSSSEINPVITYSSAGTYTVSLTVSNDAGSNTSTRVDYITVLEPVSPPIADFTANATTINTGQQVMFEDLSLNTPLSWSWVFPGGSPDFSNQQNPTVTYNSPGTYTVALTVSNSGGGDFESKEAFITVLDELQPPVADFAADQAQITAGGQVAFTDLSINTPEQWDWSFPGGEPEMSDVSDPVITYNIPGTYPVTLSVTNAAGEDSETKAAFIAVEAAVQPPVADFTASSTLINPGQQVTFTDLSANSPDSWAWQFPGGSPAGSDEPNPVVTYNTPGTYSVTLSVTNAAGENSQIKTDYITVIEAVSAPEVDFTADRISLPAGDTVNFTDLSLNTPTNWVWYCPGGTPSTSSVQNPVIAYSQPGTYDVSLIASNEAGNQSRTKLSYINVSGPNSLETPGTLVESFKVYPNPSRPEDRITASFELKTGAVLDFSLLDKQGRLIRHLLLHRAKAGINELSFNAHLLPAGTYILAVRDRKGQIVQSARIKIL